MQLLDLRLEVEHLLHGEDVVDGLVPVGAGQVRGLHRAVEGQALALDDLLPALAGSVVLASHQDPVEVRLPKPLVEIFPARVSSSPLVVTT